MAIKKAGLNGSQRLAMDNSIKAKKLNGGPANPGITQPMIPMIRQITPKMINIIIWMPYYIVQVKD
jgi:hypothetical protein